MALKISKEVRTGIIVLIAIGIFIYGLNILKGRNLFSRTYQLYAVYNNIDGLVPTNPVQINGYKVGTVKDIELMPDHSGKILVEMVITEHDLKIGKGSYAEIVSLDLLGTKAISLKMSDSLKAGKPVVGYYQDKDTLVGAVQEGIKEGVTRTLVPLQSKAKELLNSIDSVMDIVTVILNKDARNNLSKSFAHITVAMASLEKTALRLDTLVMAEKNRIHMIFVNIDHISGVLSENADKLSNIIRNLDAVSDSLARSKITSTISNANSALAHAASVLEKVNKGEGSLGLLVNDKRLYNHLDSASADLDKLLIDVNANPGRYVHISVFGGKDKKKKKKRKDSPPK